MQRYTTFFITVNPIHVSGDFSAHHQELKNCTHSIGCMSSLLAATAVAASKLDNKYNKVRELATVCLPWQPWTKGLVWFDDVDISAFHRCVVVVDLLQSLSEWHLLLSACVLVCRRVNVGA